LSSLVESPDRISLPLEEGDLMSSSNIDTHSKKRIQNALEGKRQSKGGAMKETLQAEYA
jgi:hypothetical protein